MNRHDADSGINQQTAARNRVVEHLPLWLCEVIVEVKLWPRRAVCAVVGHQRCGNDCYRCGAGRPW